MVLGKRLLVVLASLAVASGAVAEDKPVLTGTPDDLQGGLLDCSGASMITCGESQTNTVPAGSGSVATYGCTTLSYDGSAEFVYELCVGGSGGAVNLTMTYSHTTGANDLDLFLLSACDESACIDASLATSGTETISANLAAGTYYVVVDGWNGASDSTPHSLSVACDTPCEATPTEDTTWGSIKSVYRD